MGPSWSLKLMGRVTGLHLASSGTPSLPTGFFAYTCGCLVVVEDLHSGAQQHWLGHPEEISTLALSHDAQVPILCLGPWCTAQSGSSGASRVARGTLFQPVVHPEPG